jgi:hypothetical protein
MGEGMSKISDELIDLGDAIEKLVTVKGTQISSPDIWDSIQEWLIDNCHDLQGDPEEFAQRFVKDDPRFELRVLHSWYRI